MKTILIICYFLFASVGCFLCGYGMGKHSLKKVLEKKIKEVQKELMKNDDGRNESKDDADGGIEG